MADRNSPSGRKRAAYPAAAAYCGIAAAHPAGSGIPQAGYGAALPLPDTGRAADACGKIAGSRACLQTSAPEERLCFEQCFSGLGQCEAAQECERLDYYTARFEAFLQQAQQEAAACAGLSCRLGLAQELFWH